MSAWDYERGGSRCDLSAGSRRTGVAYGVVDPDVTGLPYVTGAVADCDGLPLNVMRCLPSAG